jgi:Protein of unknown function (DUF1153)
MMVQPTLATVSSLTVNLTPITNPANTADGFVDLPAADTKRWVPRRKAAVVVAIRKGTISAQEACKLYNVSAEELVHWERDLDLYGVPGLRTTRISIYRKYPSRNE